MKFKYIQLQRLVIENVYAIVQTQIRLWAQSALKQESSGYLNW